MYNDFGHVFSHVVVDTHTQKNNVQEPLLVPKGIEVRQFISNIDFIVLHS